MPAADKRKVGDRVQNEKERTGQMEEVSHHQIRGPGLLKFGEAVEDIEGVASLAFDDVVEIDRESLEEMGQLHVFYLEALSRGKDRLVLRKAYVDKIPSVLYRLIREPLRDAAELVERRDLPNDIVSKTYVLQGLVHVGNTGTCLVKSCHDYPPLLRKCADGLPVQGCLPSLILVSNLFLAVADGIAVG